VVAEETPWCSEGEKQQHFGDGRVSVQGKRSPRNLSVNLCDNCMKNRTRDIFGTGATDLDGVAYGLQIFCPKVRFSVWSLHIRRQIMKHLNELVRRGGRLC